MLPLLAVCLVMAVPARALLLDNLHGNAQVSGLQSDDVGGKTKSLGQDYNLTWSRSLISYLGADASLRYYNLGVDEVLGAHTWRQEFQPNAELFWIHPLFSITGGLTQRKSTSNDATANLIQNTSTLSFATRNLSYPILRLRYQWDHTYNSINRNVSDTLIQDVFNSNARNTRSHQWQGSLSYAAKNQNFYYSLSRDRASNYITGLNITDLQHQFRWNQTGLNMGNRLKLNSSYFFTYRSQETSRPPLTTVLKPIPFLAALYAYNPTSDLGQLDTLSALADGNTTTPVSPAIDIGRALLDRNIGIDFGFPREASALYIYTDRPSGSQLGWNIYTSNDNQLWNNINTTVTSTFNASFSRYEIQFPPQTARYFKAVNFGANDVASALVTEIEAWDIFSDTTKETLTQTSHTFDLGGSYILSRVLLSTGEIYYRLEPKGEFSNSRDQLFYNLALRHSPSDRLTQDIRFQGGTESFKVTDQHNTNTNLTYSLKLVPLRTLEFSFVALTRSNYISRMKTQESNNLFFLTKAVLLDVLTVSGDAGYNRNNLFDSGNRFDTWTYHMAAGGSITRSLDATATFMYQAISAPLARNLSIRRQYRMGINYRATQKIYFTGAIAANYETKNVFMSQDYTGSWSLTEKLSVAGGYSLSDNRNGIRSERENAQISYSLSTRTLIFANYTNSDAVLFGEGRVSFVQVGLNTGF